MLRYLGRDDDSYGDGLDVDIDRARAGPSVDGCADVQACSGAVRVVLLLVVVVGVVVVGGRGCGCGPGSWDSGWALVGWSAQPLRRFLSTLVLFYSSVQWPVQSRPVHVRTSHPHPLPHPLPRPLPRPFLTFRYGVPPCLTPLLFTSISARKVHFLRTLPSYLAPGLPYGRSIPTLPITTYPTSGTTYTVL